MSATNAFQAQKRLTREPQRFNLHVAHVITESRTIDTAYPERSSEGAR
jgi:hypothetical protein